MENVHPRLLQEKPSSFIRIEYYQPKYSKNTEHVSKSLNKIELIGVQDL